MSKYPKSQTVRKRANKRLARRLKRGKRRTPGWLQRQLRA